MSTTVTIPLWLFALLALITGMALLDRLLVPGIRWLLRRKINRVIDEISTRLSIEIRPFQLTKRQVLVDRLVYDAGIIETIHQESRRRGVSRESVMAEVVGYAREIVPSFNAYLYFRIGYWMAKRVARLLYWVTVGQVDNETLSGIDPESTVVFVMNHRSNMDYILVAFLVAERTTLSYAVGEWARIWPLQTLIRAMGAFFVRRDSRNRLYRRILERYIQMATQEGVCQAVFPEGGLSRDGRLRQPKYGIVGYMLRGFSPDQDRDIVFIPIGLNYDRVLEDRSLLRSLDPEAGRRSPWFVLKTTVRFMLKSVLLMISSRWHRFGYACVNFGRPVSMRDYCRRNGVNFKTADGDARFRHIEAVCRELMREVEAVVPVLPVPMVATVFAQDPEAGLSAFEVEARVNRLIDAVQARGGPVFVSSASRVQNIVRALNILKIRRLVTESQGCYRAEPQMLDVLTYYANSIAHWPIPPLH